MPKLFAFFIVFALVGLTFALQQDSVEYLFTKSYDIATKQPQSIEQLRDIVIQAYADKQKISILGAGKSTGGQTYAPEAIQIDTSCLNKILHIDCEHKTITVQPGITWKEIQEAIDPLDLSVMAMQSYCDFSVGGSIGVNVHGQDHRKGSLGSSIIQLQLMQADGTIVTCSRQENPTLFSCVIGGYGLFGIITQVTLQLTDNCILMRESYIDQAEDIFELNFTRIQEPDIQFFSSRLCVDADHLYEKALTILYREKSELVIEKLHDKSFIQHWMEKVFFYLLRKAPSIKKIRLLLGKSYFERSGSLFSRNNLMHSLLTSLSWSNSLSRDILQEYFIPIEQCAIFLQKARDILKKYKVNVMNTTIRYVPKDEGSILSYARHDCFSFVLYVHMQNNETTYTETQVWTRELIDVALACKGSFYLPYQHLATKQQVKAAYPQWEKFIELKKKYDPQEIFLNELYLHYS